jgi:hypothetical protein
VLVRLKEGLLNRVLRIFSVMRNALSDSKESAIVSLYELLKSINIPILTGVDEIQIIACSRFHFELCCVCRHKVQLALENNAL